MNQIIKLKNVPKFPTERMSRILSGSNYPLKSIHVSNLHYNKKLYDSHVTTIHKIDSFNLEKDLTCDDTVTIKYRQEKYTPDISKYTSLLLYNERSWSTHSVASLNQFWDVLYKYNVWDHPILTEGNTWFYNNDPSHFKETHNTQHSYNKEIYDILDNWQLAEPWYNFSFILKTINNFIKFNVIDFSATSSVLTDHRNTLTDWCNDDIDNANRYMLTASFYTNIYNRLSKNEDFYHIFPKFNFSSVFPNGLGWWLNTMHEVIQETDGAEQWLTSYNFNNKDLNVFDLASTPIGKIVMYHPKVDANGHSGGSMHQTISTLYSAYTLGWEKFVKTTLKL